MKHILIVDDEADIRELLADILEDEGYKVTLAKDGTEAKQQFSECAYDLILLDIWMPDIDGITLLSEFMQTPDVTPNIVMMSGHGTVETAVEATRLGAHDFLEKPLSMAKLLLTVQNALKHRELSQENTKLKSNNSDQIIGSSHTVNALRETISHLAQSDLLSVLISGESGTDKHTIAKQIHQQSPLSKGPFVMLPASTIALTDSAHELYGGQVQGLEKMGRLTQAQDGVLFIHQIEEMDPAAQAVLMAALEHKEFTPLNSNEKITLRCKVICSTSTELPLQDSIFRTDLFYKLNVLSMSTPSLRDHAEDIPELVQAFIDETVAEYGLNYRHFSMPAQNFMRQYYWPGNVVELKNLVQRLLVLGGDVEISKEEVERYLNPQQYHTSQVNESALYALDLKQAKNNFEKAYLLHHLESSNHNITQMAQKIGMERANMYRKLKGHNIDPRKA